MSEKKYAIGARWRHKSTGREIVVLAAPIGFLGRDQIRVRSDAREYFIERSGLNRKYVPVDGDLD